MQTNLKQYSIKNNIYNSNRDYLYFIKHSFRLVPKNYIGSVKCFDRVSLSNVANIYQYNFYYINCFNTKESRIGAISDMAKQLNLGSLYGNKMRCFIYKMTADFYDNNKDYLFNGFIFFFENIPLEILHSDIWIALLETFEEITDFWKNKQISCRIFYSQKQPNINHLLSIQDEAGGLSNILHRYSFNS